MKCEVNSSKLIVFLLIEIFLSCDQSNKHKISKSSDTPKNVLFIVVDDLNKAIGAYGNPLVKTPHIDQLFKDGIKFNNAYCNYPVCNPSRSSMLTGLSPITIGVLDNETPIQSVLGEKITLPALFKQNGFQTVGLGKVFHLPKAEHNDIKAWDEVNWFKSTTVGEKGKGRNLTKSVQKWCYWRAAEGEDEDQREGQIAKRAVEFLKEKKDKPFFLVVGFTKPHDPYVAPKKYFDMYALDDMIPPAIPENWKEPYQHSFELQNKVFPKGKQIFNNFSDLDKREFLRAYYACITFMDAQLGKVMKALKETGQKENTLVVFLSDHGYHLGEHNWWNKFTLYELATSAPLIVSSPNINKGGESNAMIEFVDIYPTIADIMGLKNIPDYLEGKTFSKLLENPEETFRTHVQSIVTRDNGIVGKSVKNNKWRYTEWEKGKQGTELYDHENDLLEYRNLAYDENYSNIIKQMKQLIK